MKRVIIAITVGAVVSSALAFNENKLGAQFCVSNTNGGSCSVINNVTEFNTGTTPLTRFAYASWDGTSGGCVTKTCSTPITLYVE